jgi:hypothetical protein
MPRLWIIILGVMIASAGASPAWAEKCLRSEWNGFERVCVEWVPDVPYEDPEIVAQRQRELQERRDQRQQARQARRDAKWRQSQKYKDQMEAWNLNNDGIAEHNAGRFEEARQLFRRAMDLHDDPAYRSNLMVAIVALARLDMHAADSRRDLVLLARGERLLAEAFRLDQPRLAKRVAAHAENMRIAAALRDLASVIRRDATDAQRRERSVAEQRRRDEARDVARHRDPKRALTQTELARYSVSEAFRTANLAVAKARQIARQATQHRAALNRRYANASGDRERQEIQIEISYAETELQRANGAQRAAELARADIIARLERARVR